MWNQHARVIAKKSRTNNAVEAHHGVMGALLGMKHPTIWRLIEGLKSLQAKTDGHMEQLVAGAAPPPARKIYRDVSHNLERIVGSYGDRTLDEFLRGVAHNLGYAA